MALGSLLLLLDDISVVLDDVALMTKVAAKKTAGVLGDDLALNAQQMLGIHAKRELPVVFAVAKGSAINKLILLPLALLFSYLSILLGWPLLVTLPLMIGGAYLCFEGVERRYCIAGFLMMKAIMTNCWMRQAVSPLIWCNLRNSASKELSAQILFYQLRSW